MIYLKSTELIADFPYSKEGVAAIKKIGGARWNPVQKVWVLPAQRLEEVREFARQYGIELSEDLETLVVPKHPIGDFGVTDDGSFLYVKFAYDEIRVSTVREIPGSQWVKKQMAWKMPVTSVLDLQAWMERNNMPVSATLYERFRQLVDSNNEQIVASFAEDSTLEVEGLGLELYAYQKAGVEYAVNAQRTFIADEMGLGKTPQSLAATRVFHQAGNLTYPVLVVCPPKLISNWEHEITTWLPDSTHQAVRGRQEFVDSIWDHDFTIIGDSNVHHWQNSLGSFNSVIIDESHRMSNGKTQRAKGVKVATDHAPGLVLLLTGTPVNNRPKELINQLALLGRLDEFGGAWKFMNRYCKSESGGWDGARNLDELNRMLRKTCYVRRKKADVLPDLPAKRTGLLYIEPSDAAVKKYEKAANDIVTYVGDQARLIAEELGLPADSAEVIARMRAKRAEHIIKLSVLRRLSASAKIPDVVEKAWEIVENGGKVIVAAHHRDIVDELTDKLVAVKIQGGMSNDDVTEAKRLFQDDPGTRAIVLSISAGGVGHNLTAAQDVIFAELPWTPSELDQVTDRAHRIGQTGSVLTTITLVDGWVDEMMYELIQAKRKVVDGVTEGLAPGKIAELEEEAELPFDNFLSQLIRKHSLDNDPEIV